MNFNEDMIPDGVLNSLTIVVSAYVVAVSGYLWTQRPQRPWPYVLAIILVGVAWLIRYAVSRNRAADPALRSSKRKITRAIIVAGLLLAIPLTRQLGGG